DSGGPSCGAYRSPSTESRSGPDVGDEDGRVVGVRVGGGAGGRNGGVDEVAGGLSRHADQLVGEVVAGVLVRLVGPVGGEEQPEAVGPVDGGLDRGVPALAADFHVGLGRAQARGDDVAVASRHAVTRRVEAAEVVVAGEPVDAAAADRVGAGVTAPRDRERHPGGAHRDDRSSLRADAPRAAPVRLGRVPVVHGAQAGFGVTAAGGGTGETAGGVAGPVADLVGGADAVQQHVGAGAGRGGGHGGGVALVGAVADQLGGGVGTHEGVPRFRACGGVWSGGVAAVDLVAEPVGVVGVVLGHRLAAPVVTDVDQPEAGVA